MSMKLKYLNVMLRGFMKNEWIYNPAKPIRQKILNEGAEMSLSFFWLKPIHAKKIE